MALVLAICRCNGVKAFLIVNVSIVLAALCQSLTDRRSPVVKQQSHVMLSVIGGQGTACSNSVPSPLAAAILRLSAKPRSDVRPVSKKPAAVLVPLFEDAEGCVRCVLTLRSSRLKSHSGEVCLPGGKAEPGDADAAATALREAHEEIALPPESVQIAAIQQQPVLSKHLLSVTPVIGVLDAGARSQLQASEAEVEAIFDCPLELFLQHSPAHKHKDVWWNETIQYRLHYFQWQHSGRTFNIWGLTAGILISIAQQTFGRNADFEVTTPGQPEYTALWSDGNEVFVRTS